MIGRNVERNAAAVVSAAAYVALERIGCVSVNRDMPLSSSFCRTKAIRIVPPTTAFVSWAMFRRLLSSSLSLLP